MKRVVTPDRMRAADAFMIEKLGIPGSILMENAAECLQREVLASLRGKDGSVLILCGTGNNGGDGLVLLRKLCVNGVRAKALLLGEGTGLRGDAKLNYEIIKASGLPISEITDADRLINEFGSIYPVIVDAIFGTGLKRAVEGIEKEAVILSNASKAVRIAADIPSGVDGLTGKVLGCAFKADVTVTFQFLKRGLLLYPGREYAGRVVIGPIGPDDPCQDSKEETLEEDDFRRLLPERKQDAHKGDSGKCFLIAGSENLSGAAHMCALAALRAGCGLLKAAVPEGVKARFSSLPEAMVFEAAKKDWSDCDIEAIKKALDASTCAAAGPGMGTGTGVADLVSEVIASGLPGVIDADGLNSISKNRELFGLLHENIILTPHPAEMSRLTGKTLQDILDNPVSEAEKAAREWGCVVHLKGATSITAAPDGRISYNLTGNPGLAKGGSGDVLTGIILAMLGQKLNSFDAARAGAYLLGCSADKAFRLLGSRILIASDIIDTLL